MRNIGGLLVGEGPRGDQGNGREEGKGEEGRGAAAERKISTEFPPLIARGHSGR